MISRLFCKFVPVGALLRVATTVLPPPPLEEEEVDDVLLPDEDVLEVLDEVEPEEVDDVELVDPEDDDDVELVDPEEEVELAPELDVLELELDSEDAATLRLPFLEEHAESPIPIAKIEIN